MDLIEIPKLSKTDCIKSFTNYILKDYSYENLYKLSRIGELGQKNLRSIAWKIFMGVLPARDSLANWVENLSYLRAEYKILSDKMIKQQNFFKEEEDKIKETKENIFTSKNTLLRKHSFMYKPYRLEKEIKKLINLDLDRTFQELALFHDEKIKNKLSHILFLWNKENSELGYQQGMNDILSIIFLSLYPYYFPNNKNNTTEQLFKNSKNKNIDNNTIIQNAENIYLFFHDEDELESDLFICFNTVMKKGIKSFYEYDFESDEEQFDYTKKLILFKNEYNLEKEELNSPLNIRCTMIIKEKLKILDKELYDHFNKIGLDCTIFLQRWLKCVFNREFELKEVLIIWDGVFSTPDIKKGYNLIKIDLIALSMILRIRNFLLLCDQNQCFMILLQYPRVDSILELIIFSDKLEEAIIDLIEGRRSIFLENVKSFIINYKKDNNEEKKNNVSVVENKNNILIGSNSDSDKEKEILPIKSYEEGVERLGNIFTKYHSLMNISDEKEFLNIIHFFNNYK